MPFEHYASMVYEPSPVVHIHCLDLLNDSNSYPNMLHNSISYISMNDRNIVPYWNTIVRSHRHIEHYRIDRDRFESRQITRWGMQQVIRERSIPLYRIYRIRSLNNWRWQQRNNCVHWRKQRVQNLKTDIFSEVIHLPNKNSKRTNGIFISIRINCCIFHITK